MSNGSIAYASQELTSAERNHSQLEKEMLAICLGYNKCYQYVYGKDILIHSDHRPQETILRKPIGSAPPRLQRMMLQRNNLNAQYLPGKLMY